MSDSDDSYGPPLPPGMDSKNDDSDSSDDQYGPPLPKKSKPSDKNIIGPTIPPVKGGNCDKYSSDSESDSSSSDSSDSDNDRKKRKKKKHKSKKSDYNKEKSDVSKESKSFIGPFIPLNLTKCEDDVSHKSIGPTLPPELAQYSDKNSSRPTNVPGNNDDDDDDDYGIGPSVNLQASEQDCSAVLEFEGRSQKMLQKLTSTAEPEKEQPIQRESWMTELPDQIGVNFGLSNRQFRAKAAPEQDHSWTKAPQEKEEKSKDGKKKKKYEILEQDKNEKASKEIEEYNKKHRPKSLLEMHQKKLEKKKKKEKKKNKDKKPERRPFDRDLDLKANRLDEAQRKAFIKRSQDLGSRFKTGGTGTSFI